MIVRSFCKVNLLLNILGKRSDGFHELETILHPIPVFDQLEFSRTGSRIRLTSNIPDLPTDGSNLIVKAATLFLQTKSVEGGVEIHLEKTIPIGADLGGGSGNAAATLHTMNSLWGNVATNADLHKMATQLGSDVPFFLQAAPALGTGRGEQIAALDWSPAFDTAWFVLVYPGFGVPTAWAYKALAANPENYGNRSRAISFVEALHDGKLEPIAKRFYNSMETPVFEKYLLLPVIKESLEKAGAMAAMMSGSGSTVFGLFENQGQAESAAVKMREAYGEEAWIKSVPAKME